MRIHSTQYILLYIGQGIQQGDGAGGESWAVLVAKCDEDTNGTHGLSDLENVAGIADEKNIAGFVRQFIHPAHTVFHLAVGVIIVHAD